jgi:hypothetical protein
MRFSKNFGFGGSKEAVARNGQGGRGGQGGGGNRGGGGGGGARGGGGAMIAGGGGGGGGPVMMMMGGGGDGRKPYNLNIGVDVQNIFNNVNYSRGWKYGIGAFRTGHLDRWKLRRIWRIWRRGCESSASRFRPGSVGNLIGIRLI